MLSRTSKQEIVRKIEAHVGHPVDEEKLSRGTRQAVSSLAYVQRNLFVISEILNGEQSRIEGNALLSVAAKVRKDKDVAAHAAEIEALQKAIQDKVAEVSQQVLDEEKAREDGKPPPDRQGGLDATHLKCPDCGAALPMPTGRFTKCEYCGSTISLQDVSSQIRTLIQGI